MRAASHHLSPSINSFLERIRLSGLTLTWEITGELCRNFRTDSNEKLAFGPTHLVPGMRLVTNTFAIDLACLSKLKKFVKTFLSINF